MVSQQRENDAALGGAQNVGNMLLHGVEGVFGVLNDFIYHHVDAGQTDLGFVPSMLASGKSSIAGTSVGEELDYEDEDRQDIHLGGSARGTEPSVATSYLREGIVDFERREPPSTRLSPSTKNSYPSVQELRAQNKRLSSLPTRKINSLCKRVEEHSKMSLESLQNGFHPKANGELVATNDQPIQRQKKQHRSRSHEAGIRSKPIQSSVQETEGLPSWNNNDRKTPKKSTWKRDSTKPKKSRGRSRNGRSPAPSQPTNAKRNQRSTSRSRSKSQKRSSSMKRSRSRRKDVEKAANKESTIQFPPMSTITLVGKSGEMKPAQSVPTEATNEPSIPLNRRSSKSNRIRSSGRSKSPITMDRQRSKTSNKSTKDQFKKPGHELKRGRSNIAKKTNPRDHPPTLDKRQRSRSATRKSKGAKDETQPKPSKKLERGRSATEQSGFRIGPFVLNRRQRTRSASRQSRLVKSKFNEEAINEDNEAKSSNETDPVPLKLKNSDVLLKVKTPHTDKKLKEVTAERELPRAGSTKAKRQDKAMAATNNAAKTRSNNASTTKGNGFFLFRGKEKKDDKAVKREVAVPNIPQRKCQIPLENAPTHEIPKQSTLAKVDAPTKQEQHKTSSNIKTRPLTPAHALTKNSTRRSEVPKTAEAEQVVSSQEKSPDVAGTSSPNDMDDTKKSKNEMQKDTSLDEICSIFGQFRRRKDSSASEPPVKDDPPATSCIHSFEEVTTAQGKRGLSKKYTLEKNSIIDLGDEGRGRDDNMSVKSEEGNDEKVSLPAPSVKSSTRSTMPNWRIRPGAQTSAASTKEINLPKHTSHTPRSLSPISLDESSLTFFPPRDEGQELSVADSTRDMQREGTTSMLTFSISDGDMSSAHGDDDEQNRDPYPSDSRSIVYVHDSTSPTSMGSFMKNQVFEGRGFDKYKNSMRLVPHQETWMERLEDVDSNDSSDYVANHHDKYS